MRLALEGSITIDAELLERGDILPFEQVQTVDINNGARFESYAISGEHDRLPRRSAMEQKTVARLVALRQSLPRPPQQIDLAAPTVRVNGLGRGCLSRCAPAVGIRVLSLRDEACRGARNYVEGDRRIVRERAGRERLAGARHRPEPSFTARDNRPRGRVHTTLCASETRQCPAPRR